MAHDSNWLPHSSDVLECTSWKPNGETTLKAFDSSLNLGIGRSCAVAAGASQLHIPELFSHSHAFGNVGGRICCISARPQAATQGIDVAISTTSHAASQIPGAVADGEGEVQFWTIGQSWHLTCEFVLGHPGGRSDAIEWCPSIDAFSGAVDGSKINEAGLGLLLLVANQSVLVFAVPVKPSDLVPTCSGKGAYLL